MKPLDKKDDILHTLSSVYDVNERIAYLRAITISKLIDLCAVNFSKSYADIIYGKPVKPLMRQLQGAPAKAMDEIQKISVAEVYNHPKVVEIEIAGFTIYWRTPRYFHQLQYLSHVIHYLKKPLTLIPEQYLSDNSNTYSKIMTVVDYISGMTDIYALETYQLFKGIKLPSL